MKMCSQLRTAGDVGAVVDIDEKRRWSLAKGSDHACHPIRSLAPALVPVVIVCIGKVVLRPEDLFDHRIIVINYQNGANRSDVSLVDKLLVMLIPPWNFAPLNEIKKLAPWSGVSSVGGSYLIRCPPAVRFARQR